MAKFSRGEIVWANVEKTAEGGHKRRLVMIVGCWPCAGTIDYLACLCSTSRLTDAYKVSLANTDFSSGGFAEGNDRGFIRPSYLTVVAGYDIDASVGTLLDVKAEEVIGAH